MLLTMPESDYFSYQPAALLRVTGEDAPTYLQSQFSNDLFRPVRDNPATYGLWLDRKGRIRADSLMLQCGPEEFLLLSEHCPADLLRAIVEENIVADEVEIEDITGQASCLRLWGAAASAIASQLSLGPGSFQNQEGCYLWLEPAPGTRPELLLLAVGETPADTLLQRIRPAQISTSVLSASEAEARRIQAKRPAIPQDLGPADLPQEGGLESYAVSFNKGCYLGQEVMARLKAMGTPRRSLHRVILHARPAKLPCPVYAGERQAGEVRSAVNNPQGAFALALLKNAALDQALTLGAPDGPALSLQQG